MKIEKHDHHRAAKAVVGFLVFFIVLVLAWKYYQNRDSFPDDPMAQVLYLGGLFAAAILLVGLYYLVNKSEAPKKVAAPRPVKSKSKTKKSKRSR